MSPLPTYDELPTPTVLVDRTRLAANIHGMQAACDAHGVELRPHIKTHKMVAIARQQLAAGARGLTCAKLSEAEAMLPSGVRSLFVAHSLVDPRQAPRLSALTEQLDDLRLAVTSEEHTEMFLRLAALTGEKLSVMMAIDTGLGREGVRDLAAVGRIAAAIGRSPHAELRGFYTHEGNLYGVPPAEQAARVEETIARVCAARDAIDRSLPVWPGCSVSARLVAAASHGRVQAVRPGTYVFGDISLAKLTGTMRADEVALHVLATVVDKPAAGLALIDAGSKTLFSDRTPANIFAIAADGRDLSVVRVSEEYGWVRGADVDALRVGERLLFMPAHVCPVVNLTDEVVVTEGGRVVDLWRVEARGRVR
ncbi:MAG: alanine racemase [Opitutia bacterium]|nr:alanine racemase [Opitutaceae bacterium]PHX85194.1 MAG: alanine racemase [Opitutae bacterium]